MKKTLFITIGFLTVLILINSFKLMQWNFKPENTKVQFYLPSDSAGSCGEFKIESGSFNFDPGVLSDSKISAKINVKSLLSNDTLKVQHILSDEFLNAEKFPVIQFVSSDIQKNGDWYSAKGKLNLKGTQKTEIVNFSISSINGLSYFNGNLEFYAGDYGVMKKSKSGSDKVKVIIQIPITKE